MKVKILFIVMLLFAMTINAQNGAKRSVLTPISNYYSSFHDSNTSEQIDISKAKGSPYEQKEFMLGDVIDMSFGKKLTGVFIRYNVYNNEIELVKNPESVNISGLMKSENVYASVDDKEYHYKEYRDFNNESKKGYLIKVRCNSKINLYKELIKTYVAPKIAKTSYHKNEVARFIDHEKYYMEIRGELVHLRMSKNKIVGSFPNNQNELKSYIKKEALSFKDEKDLIRLMAFYDTLL